MTQWANYKAPNLGLLFYKRIYKENQRLEFDGEKLTFKVDKIKSEFNDFYQDLYNQDLKKFSIPFSDKKISTHNFSLFTTYPGLIAGVGYMHGSKTTGDASIGFYFDHTTGLPTIPGSSVKGVLRSLFEVDSDGKKDFTGTQSVEAIKFIITEYETENPNSNLFSEFKTILETENPDKLKELKEEIFGNQDKEGLDIFWDAIIDLNETTTTKFLDSDYITPHYPDLLKDPTPNQFLKVLPKVGFQFRFDLKDGKILTAEQKLTLFKKILLTIGIGAKTNVGYGQFVEDAKNNNAPQKETNSKSKEDNHSGNKSDSKKSNGPIKSTNSAPTVLDSLIPPSEETLKIIKANTESEGKIISKKGNNFLIEMPQYDGSHYTLKKKEDKFKDGSPEIGKKVKIVFLENKSVNSFHAFVLEN